MRRGAVAALAVALLAASCAGPRVERMEPGALRRAAAEGDAGAARRLAEAVAAGRVEGARLEEARRLLRDLGPRATPADRALAARLAGAAGEPRVAFEAWVALASDPVTPAWLARYGALRAREWVDRVDLRVAPTPFPLRPPGDPAGPAVAHLAEAVAVRRGDDDALDRARARIGWVERFDRTGRLAAWPALALPGSEAILTGLDRPERTAPAPEEGIETPDGTVAFREEGPGLYAARVPLPPGAGPFGVEVLGSAGVRIFVDGGEVRTNDRLGAWRPRRLVARLPASAGSHVEIQVASRSAAPRVRVAVREAPEPVGAPPVDRLMGRLAALEDALWRGAPVAAHRAAGVLADDALGVAALDLARYAAMDPTRPMNLTRPRERRLLERALERLPDLHEARSRLARHLLDAGEISAAEGLVAGRLPAPLEAEAALATARAKGWSARAGRLARAALERVPTSCDAALTLLELRWEPLRYGPSRLPETLPGCFEVRHRVAVLLREGRRLDEAERRLETLLQRAAPGGERTRVREALARVAWARGDRDAVVRHAQAGLDQGRRSEVFLDLLRSGALLASRDAEAAALAERMRRTRGVSVEARRSVLDPEEDLGLPLEDGEAVARDAHARAAGEESDSDAPAEVLLEEHHVRAFPDGMLVHRVHRIFRIHDADAAEEWGEISLPAGAEVLRALTWKPTPDGDLQPIEPEDLQATGAISLTALQPGAIGEAAWFWSEPPDPALDGGWMLERFAFERADAPVEQARLIVRAPPGAPVAFATTGRAPRWSVPQPGVSVLTAHDRPRVLPEPLDPRPDRRMSTVRVVGGGADRERLRRHLVDRLRTATRRGPVVERLASRALEEAGAGPEARLRALYDVVLDRIQAGEDLPWDGAASWIAATRAGERTTLLLALCAEEGLSCELTLARPRSRGVPDPRGTPADPDDWIYPLVRARLPGGDVWLDPSTRYVPFGYVPPLVQGTPALRLAEGRAVIRTPDLSEAGGVRDMDVTITVDPDGSWRAVGEETLSVLHGMSWRHVLADMVPEARERGLAGVVRQSLPGAAVQSVSVEGLHARGEPLVFRWEATGRLPDAGGGRRTLALGLSPERLSRSTVHLPERETPLFLERDGNLRMTVRIQLPEGWRLSDLPEPMEVRHEMVRYRRGVRLDGDARTLVLTKRYRQHLGLVPPEDYRAWIDAARAVDRADALHLVLVEE
ncbi:MAG: hypothetical protein ACQEXJ_00365 [Myxococcota bacterium]